METWTKASGFGWWFNFDPHPSVSLAGIFKEPGFLWNPDIFFFAAQKQ